MIEIIMQVLFREGSSCNQNTEADASWRGERGCSLSSYKRRKKKLRYVVEGINNDYGWDGRGVSKRFYKSLCSCVLISCNTGVTMRYSEWKSCRETHTHVKYPPPVLLSLINWLPKPSPVCLQTSTTHRCLFCSLKQHLCALLPYFTKPYSCNRSLQIYSGEGFCTGH